jgi:16S rRNA (guanine966-N2)-methyltransferase
MRIISGKFRGRRIQLPTTIEARPTTDFAKEGLFNLLNNRIEFEGCKMLDLFSGTGSIGFEFVSRGAESATLVEINERHCRFIRKVCTDLSIKNILLIKGDAIRFIQSGNGSYYDFIFADPPYAISNMQEIPDLILNASILSENGLFVLEHSSKNTFKKHECFTDHRTYGNVNFSFFEKK